MDSEPRRRRGPSRPLAIRFVRINRMVDPLNAKAAHTISPRPPLERSFSYGAVGPPPKIREAVY